MNSEVETNSQLNERVLKDRFEYFFEGQEQNYMTTGRVLEEMDLPWCYQLLLNVEFRTFLEGDYIVIE